MARKKEEEVETPVLEEIDPVKLSKALVKAFNKDQSKTGQVAWYFPEDEDNPTEVTEWISTGNTLLDYCISNRRHGGVPVGKLTEIVGEEASGKSLLIAHLIAECQKKGGIAALLDSENAFNPDFAQQVGVDLKKMIYLQPNTVEEAGEQIAQMILMVRQKAPKGLCLICLDSTAQLPTKVELEGNFEINMNVQMEKPKALGKMMRKITQVLGKERICLVFTNQLKFKPGVMYGDPLFAPGGKAVPYAASVRIRLDSGAKAKEGADIIDLDKDEKGATDGDVFGVHTKAKVIKNRLGPPHRQCRFFISFADGIQNEQSWFQFLRDEKLIAKKDGWCTIEQFRPVLVKHYQDAIPSAADDKVRKELERQLEKAQDWKFRASQWEEVIDSTPGLRNWLEDKIDSLMVVRYDKLAAADVDEESLLEVEQLVDDLNEEDDRSALAQHMTAKE